MSDWSRSTSTVLMRLRRPSVRSAISSMVSVFALVLFQGAGLTAAAAVGVATLIGPIQVGGRILEVVFGRWLNPLVTSILGALLLPVGVAAMLGGAPVAAFAVAYGMSNGILTISREPCRCICSALAAMRPGSDGSRCR